MLSPPLLPLSPVWSHAAMGGARGCGVAVPSLSLNEVIDKRGCESKFYVVVGSCSSGKHGDCPGGAGHQMLCCDLPEYYYSACDTFSGGWGVLMDCRY